MSAHTISEKGAAGIRKRIDDATSAPDSIPGCVFVTINKNGEETFAHASGQVGASTKEPMTLDTIFWIASCTKMVAGIACMQLVEQGKLHLDDADEAAKLVPELARVKVFDGYDSNGKPKLVEKKKGITLRMLLSHTAGFGYSFFNEEVRDLDFDEFTGNIKDIEHPLLFQPGTKWAYGTNIDWAGIMLERLTGRSLNDYCNENIFTPLDIKNMSFFPTQENINRLAHMHQRSPEGKVSEREHLLTAPLKSPSAAEQKNILNSAGAGIFAQPREYVKIIATLLNNGTSPNTKAQILKPETVDQMFTNQIPEMPQFGRQGTAAAIPELTNPIAELYPQPKEQEQGWGLTFMITVHPGATGRGRNTGWWAGLPNLFWWADREKGVGGMVASQILPFGDGNVMGLWAECESLVYQG